MRLYELLRNIPGVLEIRGDDVDIADLSYDSRKSAPGHLFFCVVGKRTDGHDYALQAVEAGAVALVVTRFLDLDVPQVKVEEIRSVMAHVSAAFFGYPGSRMKLIGVTGTAGKTSTCYMIRAIMRAAGHKVGLIGTITNMIGDQMLPAVLTTPESVDLQRLLKKMLESGCTVVVMEASAHALDMSRLVELTFDVAVYTNLSMDHLDHFGTMDIYRDAKRKLFTPDMARHCVINADDENSEYMMHPGVPCTPYSIRVNSDVYAADIDVQETGIVYRMHFNREQKAVDIALRMFGVFNVYNSMAAAITAHVLGVSFADIARGLNSVTGVPGRIEVLETGTPITIVLDYAHKPDSLESILKAVRGFAHGRLITLFGCGGDRDKEKRPVMGEIAGSLSDYCVLTSDNPRNEHPMEIISAIEEGIRKTPCQYIIIENRRDAITKAINMASPGDVVVLAGKGHETYQEISGIKTPFNERIIVNEILSELGLA